MKRILPAVLLAALFALPAPAANTGHAVYRPGLTQARIPFGSPMGYVTAYTGVPNLASNLLATADADWLDRTLGVFKDGGTANNASNPVSGLFWPWLLESDHGVFAYEGEMYVEAGTAYSFYGRNYNGEALVVAGAMRVSQGPRNAWNYAPEVFGAWTPEESGWVDFNAWLWSWNGSTGSVSDKCAWGLQWNPDGIVPAQTETTDVFTLAKDTNIWHRFVDPGDGSFLRTVTGERFTTVVSSAAVSGGRSFELSFSDVPTNATLVAFSGAFDGGHVPAAWDVPSGALAQVPAGDSTATVSVPLAADARVLRFRLATGPEIPADGVHPFEEWTEMIAVSPSPVVRLDSVSPGYTNAVVSWSLGSFGLGGSSGAVTVEIATADDASFASPVCSLNLPPVSAVGSFSAELFGLATNTAYLARATLRNDRNVSGVSDTVPFRTVEPGPAAAALAVKVAAFQSATLAATVSDWGGGSWGAEAWIDVSADESFPDGGTQSLPLGALEETLPATATATAENLLPDSGYFARVRTVNSWGCRTVSAAVPFRTADTPIAFSPPEAVAVQGYVYARIEPTFVEPGTVYTVRLSASGGATGGDAWGNQTGLQSFSWGRPVAAGVSVTFHFTVDWTHAGSGKSGTITFDGVSAVAKLADRTIASLPEIDPAVGGVYLRPGDSVEIIPSSGTRVDWHTNAVLSITQTNGIFLLEALEPGAVLLYETETATGKTNNVTGVAIVLPAEDPAGGIYVRRRLANFSWTDPNAWEMVAAGPQGYPDAPGAWVYVATPSIDSAGPDYTIQVTEQVTIGNLAVGQLGWIHHGYPKAKSHWSWTFGDNGGLGGAIQFDSGDGSESRILTLGHAYNVSRVQFKVPVSAANDLAVDELWRVQDDIGAWANTWDFGLSFERAIDFGTNTFRNVRGNLYHYVTSKVWSSVEGNGAGARGFLQFYGDVLGSGTIRLEADSMVGCVQGEVRDLSFTGTWDVANGQNVSCYGGSGFTWPGTSLGRAREMIIRGSWLRADLFWPGGAFARNAEEGDNWHMFKGWTNDWRNVLPSKLTLDGGCLYLHPNYLDAGWTQYGDDPAKTRRIAYEVDTLDVPSGPMGFLSIKKSSNDLRYPDQYTTIGTLTMAPGAVLALEASDSAVNKTNEIVIVNEPVGWTDPGDADKQFLPYLFANQQLVNNPQYCGSSPYIVPGSAVDNAYLFFRDRATGRVSREAPATTGNGYRRWTAGETLANGAQYYSMQLAANVTNAFEAGATVRNLAGYVDMRKGAALGRPGEDAGATLDFGNEPARLFVGNWGETGTVGCRIAGTAGLVKGGSGALVLGASAAGIAGGVRVAGGTLALGAPDGDGRMRPSRVSCDVVVEAGSRLVVRARNALSSETRLALRDRPWIPSVAHVRLEENACVRELCFGDSAASSGTWGSSESSAEHVDDVHFEGPGVLTVGVHVSLMILR